MTISQFVPPGSILHSVSTVTVFYDKFAEAYSISDLHLGVGDAVDEVAVNDLATTIGGLRERASKLSVGDGWGKAVLVVNGDTVDFLSVPDAKEFDAEGAAKKLQSIFDEPKNSAFWDALAAFAETNAVVITLGNHDLELALPECQALLRRRIGGRLILAFDGAGYRCQVGTTTALFLHGNNQDEWNEVDFDRLGRIAAALNAGRKPERWQTNEGTKLVIQLLNEQKQKHPFVEFVKPEKPWLMTLIAKLGFGSLLLQGRKLIPRQVRASGRGLFRQASARRAYLGTSIGTQEGATVFDADDILIEADRRFRRKYRVLSAAAPADEVLGRKDILRQEPASDEEIRQHILDSLRGQTAFLPNQSDDIYKSLEIKLGREVHWVVCGHTHLRRAYQDRSDRVYFNSGTWMRLMDLYDAAAREDQLPKVMAALNAKTKPELDAITWLDKDGKERPIAHREPTVVMLQATDVGATGWLAEGTFDSNKPDFKEVKDTKRSVTL